MIEETVPLEHSAARGYVIPAGPVSLVHVIAAKGMVGCGAFDVQALEAFLYPAAKVRPVTGPCIASVEDLLKGIVRETNPSAERMGVKVGMTGRTALDLMS